MDFQIATPEHMEAREFVEKWMDMYEKGAVTRQHLMSRLADFALDHRDPDFQIAPRKEFIVGLGEVQEIDGGYVVVGRNGDKPIKVGDYMNNCRVEKIEAYGRELPELGEGMTGAITLKGRHLSFTMREYKFDWSWRTEEANVS